MARWQTKYQWDRLNVEGCKIINKILTATPEKVEWLEGTEPKFTRKTTTKATRVAYDTKMKRYTYHNNSVIVAREPISLETSDAFFHFCYHPERKQHIRIESPARLETDAKYIATVSSCHWVQERNITVIALLTYATWNAQRSHRKLRGRKSSSKCQRTN